MAGHGSAPDAMRTSMSLPCPGHPLGVDAFHHRAYRHERASFGEGSPPPRGTWRGAGNASRRTSLASTAVLHPAVQSDPYTTRISPPIAAAVAGPCRRCPPICPSGPRRPWRDRGTRPALGNRGPAPWPASTGPPRPRKKVDVGLPRHAARIIHAGRWMSSSTACPRARRTRVWGPPAPRGQQVT